MWLVGGRGGGPNYQYTIWSFKWVLAAGLQWLDQCWDAGLCVFFHTAAGWQQLSILWTPAASSGIYVKTAVAP